VERRAGLTALALALLAGGCGGDEPSEPVPAAEPAESPALSERPAGEVLRVGGELEGVVADPRTGLAAVTVRGEQGSRLALVGVERWRVERRVPLPSGGRHLALAAPGGPVLVPAEGSDELVTVALPSGRTQAISVGDFPHDAASAGGRVFVGDEFADTVSVIEDGVVVDTLDAPDQPGGVAAGNGVVAVVAVAARVLHAYDASTLETLGAADAGEGPTHVAAHGDRAFVVDTAGEAIREFQLGARPRLVSRIPARGAPYGIAIDPRRDRLWLTLTASNEAVEFAITPGGLKRLDTYATVRQPNTVAVDPRSGDALIAGRSAGGPLQRIDVR
jgi:DNA-binding beta-propeller fold protein YncE